MNNDSVKSDSDDDTEDTENLLAYIASQGGADDSSLFLGEVKPDAGAIVRKKDSVKNHVISSRSVDGLFPEGRHSRSDDGPLPGDRKQAPAEEEVGSDDDLAMIDRNMASLRGAWPQDGSQGSEEHDEEVSNDDGMDILVDIANQNIPSLGGDWGASEQPATSAADGEEPQQNARDDYEDIWNESVTSGAKSARYDDAGSQESATISKENTASPVDNVLADDAVAPELTPRHENKEVGKQKLVLSEAFRDHHDITSVDIRMDEFGEEDSQGRYDREVVSTITDYHSNLEKGSAVDEDSLMSGGIIVGVEPLSPPTTTSARLWDVAPLEEVAVTEQPQAKGRLDRSNKGSSSRPNNRNVWIAFVGMLLLATLLVAILVVLIAGDGLGGFSGRSNEAADGATPATPVFIPTPAPRTISPSITFTLFPSLAPILVPTTTAPNVSVDDSRPAATPTTDGEGAPSLNVVTPSPVVSRAPASSIGPVASLAPVRGFGPSVPIATDVDSANSTTDGIAPTTDEGLAPSLNGAPVSVPTAPVSDSGPSAPAGTAPSAAAPLTQSPVALSGRLSAGLVMFREYTSSEALDGVSSPQYLAIKWLADEDPLQQPIPPTSPDMMPKLLQRYALLTLWYSTNGDQWKKSFDFRSGKDECMWTDQEAGVVCNDVFEITALSLPSNQLSGAIPAEISLLTKLSLLRLSNNMFVGAMPEWLGQLSRLESLELNGNYISGSIPYIPDSIKTLDLSNNYLTGEVPTKIGNQDELSRLSLHSNTLGGSINGFVGRLTSLTTLTLADNLFSEELQDTGVDNLKDLRHLDLSSNSFFGSVPLSMFQLPALQVMDLSSNLLTGTIVDEISGDSKLVVVSLYNNKLAGRLPVSFENLSALTRLDLSTNAFTGEIPDKYIFLANLQALFLSSNFDVTIPSALFELTTLKELSLSQVSLTGIPRSIGKLTDLEYLDLSRNRIAGTIPTELAQLTNLQFLLLNRNEISGSTPTELLELTNLVVAHLDHNNLEGETSAICLSKELQSFIVDCEVVCGCCSQCCSGGRRLEDDNDKDGEEGDDDEVLPSLTTFISEFHYNNIGADVDQVVEVAFSNELDVSGYKVELYRGRSGLAYDTVFLLDFSIGESVNGLTFASHEVDSFLNDNSGLALIDGNDNVVEFISYDGSFTAIEGYAATMTSVDIGVSQSGEDPQGWTLQKTGSGCMGDEFEWGVNAEGTVGDVNVGMKVTCDSSIGAVDDGGGEGDDEEEINGDDEDDGVENDMGDDADENEDAEGVEGGEGGDDEQEDNQQDENGGNNQIDDNLDDDCNSIVIVGNLDPSFEDDFQRKEWRLQISDDLVVTATRISDRSF